jgi:hypothetical protein
MRWLGHYLVRRALGFAVVVGVSYVLYLVVGHVPGVHSR